MITCKNNKNQHLVSTYYVPSCDIHTAVIPTRRRGPQTDREAVRWHVPTDHCQMLMAFHTQGQSHVRAHLPECPLHPQMSVGA